MTTFRKSTILFSVLFLSSSYASAEQQIPSTTDAPPAVLAPAAPIMPNEPLSTESPATTTEPYVNPYTTPIIRTITDVDGNTYTGPILNGQPEGQIEVNYTDGRKYVGEFSNWGANGQGVLTYPDNMFFTGRFQDNYPVQGRLTLADGKSFQDGTFRIGDPILLAFQKGNADLQREGKLGNKNITTRWVGTFEGENMTKGKIMFPNGDLFIGASKLNPAHQFSERFGYHHPIKTGTYQFKNGDVFKGTWSYHEAKNIISAKGTFQKKKQKAKSATWSNGKITLSKK